MNDSNKFIFVYKSREFIIDMYTLTYFYSRCASGRVFGRTPVLLSEDNSGDFFSSEMPVVFLLSNRASHL